MQYDQTLGLNSMRELNPAMENLTRALDVQLAEVGHVPASLPLLSAAWARHRVRRRC